MKEVSELFVVDSSGGVLASSRPGRAGQKHPAEALAHGLRGPFLQGPYRPQCGPTTSRFHDAVTLMFHQPVQAGGKAVGSLCAPSPTTYSVISSSARPAMSTAIPVTTTCSWSRRFSIQVSPWAHPCRARASKMAPSALVKTSSKVSPPHTARCQPQHWRNGRTHPGQRKHLAASLATGPRRCASRRPHSWGNRPPGRVGRKRSAQTIAELSQHTQSVRHLSDLIRGIAD